MSAHHPGVGRGALPAVVVIVVVFGAGLVGALVQSLQASSLVGGPLSLAAWSDVLADPAFRDAVAFTLWTTAAATLVAAVAGVALASLLRGSAPHVRALVAAPLAIPHLVVAVGVVAWLGPGGLVDRAIGLPLDVAGDPHGLGITLVYAVKEAPFVALAVLAAWDDDTRRREEAAGVLGAGALARLRLVTLPRIAPAVIVSALLVAAFAVGSFEVALLAGPTSPQTIAGYAYDQARSPSASAPAHAASALLVATLLAVTAALVAGRRLERWRG